MKRYCKNVDITEVDFIESAIKDRRSHRKKKDLQRTDVRRLYSHFGNDERKIAEELSEEIKERNLRLAPVRTKDVIDTSNGKARRVCIESAKQQMLNYIASHGLQPIMGRIGEYQCTGLPGRGTIWGLERLKGWYKNPSIRYLCQVDICKNYPSISVDMIEAFLRKHVANEALIWLIVTLLRTNPTLGLPIGSVLSVYLDALYLSQAYHYIKEDMYRVRRGKRLPMVKHTLFFVDDIAMLCSSRKDAEAAGKLLQKYMATIGLSLHDDYAITEITGQSYQDMLGFREYRDHVTMRRRDYIKVKAALRSADHDLRIATARRAVAMSGFIKHSDSYRFRKKYHSKRILRNARRYISRYEKGILYGKAGSSADHDHRGHDHGADLPE